MTIEIGAHEAKTRLPELLKQVKAGKRFTITNRGKALADLVPSRAARAADKPATVARFQAYLRSNPLTARASINNLIGESRA